MIENGSLEWLQANCIVWLQASVFHPGRRYIDPVYDSLQEWMTFPPMFHPPFRIMGRPWDEFCEIPILEGTILYKLFIGFKNRVHFCTQVQDLVKKDQAKVDPDRSSYLSTSEANGCTTNDVPITIRRSH